MNVKKPSEKGDGRCEHSSYRKDAGNAKAGAAVAQAAQARGIAVDYLLDDRGAARQAFDQDAGFRTAFHGRHVLRSDGPIAPYNFVFVTLSAAGGPNLEQDSAARAARSGLPVYGYEEVPGGRNNPGWGEGEPAPVQQLRRLFTTVPTDADEHYPNVTVVGFSGLEWYRGKDIPAIGRATREKLGIPHGVPLVFYTGHPEPENPFALLEVGDELLALDTPGTVLVVARHGRELTAPIPGNGAAHGRVLRHLARHGLRVIEHSLAHRDLPASHPDAIPPEFRPPVFISLQELLCTCAEEGVVVTGFGTDGALVAPFLGIPSILYLADDLFGAVLRREKKLSRWPLPGVLQATTERDLRVYLRSVFAPGMRFAHIQDLRTLFHFPEKPAGALMVDTIIADLRKSS